PHDAFSIMTALSMEASGFAERGQAIKFADKVGIGMDGQLPLNSCGGLKGRGHPVGATGVYQVVEVAKQIRQEVPAELQIKKNSIGMAQNIGGSGATVITTILKKID
ncbi:MAG: thiolase domain-containing protein, partial [Calditrichaceae bacterium]